MEDFLLMKVCLEWEELFPPPSVMTSYPVTRQLGPKQRLFALPHCPPGRLHCCGRCRCSLGPKPLGLPQLEGSGGHRGLCLPVKDRFRALLFTQKVTSNQMVVGGQAKKNHLWRIEKINIAYKKIRWGGWTSPVSE